MTSKPKGKAKPAKKPAAESKAKPKPVKAAAPKANQVARKVIAEDKLKSLLRTCAGLSKEQASIGGSIREKIGYAKEHHHLNTEVFGLIRRLDKKEPEALAMFLDDFEHMLDISGLGERADQVQALPLNAGKSPGGGKSEPKQAAKPAGNGKDKAGAAGDDGAVVKPAFGGATVTGEAPGGPVTMLPDAKKEAVVH